MEKIKVLNEINAYEKYPNKKLGFFLVFSFQGLLIIAVTFFHNASILFSDYCDTTKSGKLSPCPTNVFIFFQIQSHQPEANNQNIHFSNHVL